ncbi:hypothetical protein Q8A67_008923 [Cirrhinus molitorella]|uniref:Ig-like domain-containing protein n=1 Tax=Cirrhinus molitorella TaxID=172907 RepID=A0AA88PY95_9TELE|nr:hypothetical protein Q8A67_008923 [Cirrhinus molitorella]
MLFLFLIIISLLKENADANTINPLDPEKRITVGDNVTLSCQYTGIVNTLQWYRQYPGSQIEYLIFATELSGRSESALRLESTANRGTKHGVCGNVIRPDETSVVLTEGNSTTLSCTFDESAYSLHWYRQKPGSKPEFLLLIVKSTNTEVPASPPHPHMSIKLRNDNRVDLQISSAAVSDSALYYCALVPTVTGKPATLYKNCYLFFAILFEFYSPYTLRNKGESNGDVIRPNQPFVLLTEGSNTTLSCTYDGSAYSLHWYRQNPGSPPEFLLLIVKSTKTVVPASPPHPHMSIRHHDNKTVDLHIFSAAVSDSAMYYCALEPTVTGKPATLYKNLLVILHSHSSLP